MADSPAQARGTRVTPERWRKIKSIIENTPSLPDERRAFLDHACGDDAELRREVGEMLAVEEEVDEFLAGPAVPGLRHVLAGTPAPRRIGAYRTVELIERGGMGEVYLARREDDFEKQVALKLLPEEIADDATVKRFHKERQILA
ncbi:MAG: hypothetical protein GY856_46735, partial [bacterium]|nr:hypothetical protein [bacterium]